jgi:hypothetical protein
VFTPYQRQATIDMTMPKHLVELYHLWKIQSTARVHEYPFDIWLYKMSNIRHGIRHPFDRIRKRRNQNLLNNLPEQKNPNKYLADILHKTTNVQDEISKKSRAICIR